MLSLPYIVCIVCRRSCTTLPKGNCPPFGRPRLTGISCRGAESRPVSAPAYPLTPQPPSLSSKPPKPTSKSHPTFAQSTEKRKKRKNPLTNREAYGIMGKLRNSACPDGSSDGRPEQPPVPHREKFFKKLFQNPLTKGCGCDIIDKLSTREPRKSKACRD